MLHLHDLVGRAVVDLETATRIGHVDDVVLDPEGCRVAALVVLSGQSFLGGGDRRILDAGTVHSIGPDAVTVHGSGPGVDEADLALLPRRREVLGRKVVGESGKMFGHISDVLVDPTTGRIVGYAMENNPLSGLENILTGARPRPRDFLRADAALRVGPELVVVPDAAVVSGDLPETGTAGAEDGWASVAGNVAPSAWKTHAPDAPNDHPGSPDQGRIPTGPPPLDTEPAGYEELAPSAEMEIR